MPPLQTVGRIIATSTHPVYVIDWNLSSEHGTPEGLSPPVKEWLETKCPEVEVGRLDYPIAPKPHPSIRVSREERITALVFLIGLNAEQADAFITDLSCSQSRLSKPLGFYFIPCAPKQLGALIQLRASNLRRQFLGRLRNFMRATTHKSTAHSKENQYDHTHHH